MSRVMIRGIGAISPAGWGVEALADAVRSGQPIATTTLARPGWSHGIDVRKVPPPAQRPAFFAHPRLRRVSPISQYTVAAALEALGEDLPRIQSGELRLGILLCVMPGCVSYSRRFYEEVLRDPGTASPLFFPETVFNAPASHLSAYLNSPGRSYTVVGDGSSVLQAMAIAASWLVNDNLDGCLIVGAEEMDWVVADATRLLQRSAVHSEGAGAIYLVQADSGMAELERVTDAFGFGAEQTAVQATIAMQKQFPLSDVATELLYLSGIGVDRPDEAELAAWKGWPGKRLMPKAILGEAFTAVAAWQCVLAVDMLAQKSHTAANISVAGINQQAIGARLIRAE